MRYSKARSAALGTWKQSVHLLASQSMIINSRESQQGGGKMGQTAERAGRVERAPTTERSETGRLSKGNRTPQTEGQINRRTDGAKANKHSAGDRQMDKHSKVIDA